jgi:hypothetical protein
VEKAPFWSTKAALSFPGHPEGETQMSAYQRIKGFIQGHPGQNEGVARINIYLLRLVYLLMFFVLGRTTWTHILTHQGAWETDNAMAWCVWTAFATLAGIGILHPLKMLPLLLAEIFYKVLWLVIVAYPLWSEGKLAGSTAESTTSAFMWVLLPVVAVPWGYVFATYIYKRSAPSPLKAGQAV